MSFASFGEGPATASADTRIVMLVKPRRRCKTRLKNLQYLSAGTAHTLYVMRPFAFCTITGGPTVGTAPVATDTVVNINRNPGAFAANAVLDGRAVPSVADNLLAASDRVVIELPDGNYHVTTVSSISTLAVTLADAIPAGGVLIGAKLWHFGVEANTDPNTGKVHPAFSPTVSVVSTYGNTNNGIVCETIFEHSPMLIVSTNATAAGTILTAAGDYPRG